MSFEGATDMQQLMVKSGSRYRRATPSEVCETASHYAFRAFEGKFLRNPRDAREFLMNQAGLDHEQFGCVYLDNRHRVLRVEILFTGTIDGASVHPREVVKAALRESAAAVILFHNHPSQVGEPSKADEMITNRLRDALSLIDVRVLDHVIIAGPSLVSMAERGLI